MIQKTRRALLAVAVLLVAVMALVLLLPTAEKASGQTDYAYRLDFADATALGRNTGEQTYADATVASDTTAGLTQIDGPKGQKAVQFPTTANPTPYSNYLSLPTSVFAGAQAATVAGWFYAPSTLTDYTCELCIFTPENNKALRVDPRASGANNNGSLILYGNMLCWDGEVRPVYDAWRHMAYVMEAGKVSIYVNGMLVEVVEDAAMTSPALFDTATAQFYLGQNVYEANHLDYTGAMSDIRIYRKALTAQEIATEYDFEYTDFLTTEFTFDDSEEPYKENIRGYDAVSIRNGDNYTQASSDPILVSEEGESVLRLDGTSALTVSSNIVSGASRYTLEGHNQLTISVDFKLNGDQAMAFAPIWDIFTNNSKRVAAMAQREVGNSMDFFYGNPHTSPFDQNRFVVYQTGKHLVLTPDVWCNLTCVMNNDYMEVWLDGKLVAREVAAGNAEYKTPTMLLGDWADNAAGSYLTLGSPVHRVGERANVDLDNLRIYAYTLSQSDVCALAASNRLVADKFFTLTYGEEQLSVAQGDVVTLPSTYEKDGYVFGGWYDNEACTGEPITQIEVTQNTTLWAKWHKIHTITYLGVDGLEHANPTEYTALDTITLVAPEKTGYRFVGWFDGETQYTEIKGMDRELILTAHFEEITYGLTLTVDDTYGSFVVMAGNTEVKQSGLIRYSDRALVITATPQEDYVPLVRKDDEQIGAGQDGKYYVTLTGDTVLSLSFVTNGWKLEVALDETRGTLSLGGQNYGNGSFTLDKDHEGELVIRASKPYYINEIAVGSETVTPEYGTTEYRKQIRMTADLAISVTFAELNEYTIAFAAENARGEMDPIMLLYGEEKALPLNTFERKGYIFAGWSYGGTTYQDGQVIKNLTRQNERLTLTAQWAAMTYTVRYDANGGSGEIASQSATYGVALTLATGEELHREGHTFAGWALGERAVVAYEGGATASDLTLVANDTVVLYARWAVNCYTVTVNGPDAPVSATLSYREALRLADLVTVPQGKVIEGFATEQGGAIVYGADDVVVITDTLTVYVVLKDATTPSALGSANGGTAASGCGASVNGTLALSLCVLIAACLIAVARRRGRSR